MAAAAAAASLLEWLALYEQPHAPPLRHDAQSCADALETLLQRAFPQLYAAADDAAQSSSSAWERIVRVLEQFYETPLGIDAAHIERDAIDDRSGSSADVSANETLVRVLELALGAVVQCDDKATFVRDILTMRDAVQVDLMAVIERVMAQQSSSSAGGIEGPDAASPSETTEDTAAAPALSPAPASPHLHLARNAELERAKRENAFLHDENSRMRQELQAAATKLQRRDAANLALSATIEELALQRDVDLLRKERSVRAMYDDRLHALERDLDAANAALLTRASAATEVSELRDELDLLRPVAARATKAEAAAAKYKRKIEELAGVREALRRTEAANAELMTTNLSLEAHVAKTTALERKLREAKEAKTAIEFRVSELDTLLARHESELERLRTDVATSERARAEATALNAQLQQAIDAHAARVEDAGADAGALGDGMSELNPELMQTLARLEHENSALRAQVSGETSARIDELVDQLDDVTRLKTSFETRYFATEQQLQALRHELAASQAAVQALERELGAGHAREAALRAQLTSLETAVRDQTETSAALRQELSVLWEHNAALETDVESQRTERRSTSSEVDCLKRVVEQLEQRSAAQAHALRDAAAEREELCQTLDASQERTREHEATIVALETQIATLQRAQRDLETANQTLAGRASELNEALAVADDALASRRLELTALAALFGATFEANHALEAKLSQSLDDKRALQAAYEVRLSDAQQAQTRLAEAQRQHVARLDAAHSASLARMTDAMSAKSMQIETLGVSLERLEHEHAVAVDELTARHEQAQSALQAEMAQYKAQHSVSNVERDTKERELAQQLDALEAAHRDERNAMIEHAQRLVLEIERLNATASGLRDHEAMLRATIAQQLESNEHLVTANRSFKAELKRRAATIAALEHATTRLESRVHLLAKERAHLSSRDERTREAAQDEASVAAQLSSHISLVVAELERAHAALLTRAQACQCASSSRADTSTADGAKTPSYVDRIRDLERLKQRDETKRRELLLVNAKLVQTQRQLQTKNAALEREMQDVREKMNSWLLRDARRRSEADAMRRKLADLTATTPDAQAADMSPAVQGADAVAADVMEPSVSLETALSDPTPSALVDTANAKAPPPEGDSVEHDAGVADENQSPNIVVTISRKRRLDDGEEDAAMHRAHGKMRSEPDASASRSTSVVTDAADVASRSASRHRSDTKRRTSLFISSHLQSSRAGGASEEKPSECQQQ